MEKNFKGGMKMQTETVKGLLKQMERSQAWLSRRVDVTPATMSYWLNGIVTPKVGVVQRIADILGVGINTIKERESE